MFIHLTNWEIKFVNVYNLTSRFGSTEPIAFFTQPENKPDRIHFFYMLKNQIHRSNYIEAESSRLESRSRDVDTSEWSTAAVGGEAFCCSGSESARSSRRLFRFHSRRFRHRRCHVQGIFCFFSSTHTLSMEILLSTHATLLVLVEIGQYKLSSWLAIIFCAQSLANMRNVENDLKQISMAMMWVLFPSRSLFHCYFIRISR